MTEPNIVFAETLRDISNANTKCVQLATEFSQLAQTSSSTEAVFTCAESLIFEPTVRPNDRYVLRLVGDRQKIQLKSLKECFSFQNVLKTSLPEYQFQDLSEEIAVYNLLDAEKGMALAQDLFSSLQRVEQKLQERVSEIRSKMGLATKVVELFGTNGKKEIYFQRVRETNKRLGLNFEIKLGKEADFEDLEELARLIKKYFTPITDDQETKEITKSRIDFLEKTRQPGPELSSDLFSGSLLVENGAKDQLVRWIEEEKGKLKHTDLLFRGTRDGFDCETFHKKCDNQGKTVVVIKSSNGSVFGGYANVPWHSKNEWIADEEKRCFVFSLDQKCKFKVKDPR